MSRLALLFLMGISPIAAIGQGNSFTQIGSFTCTNVRGKWQCPTQNFDYQFGQPPRVIVSFATFSPILDVDPATAADGHFANIIATNITSTSFNPAISLPNGAGPLVDSLMGTYVAVGPILYTGHVIPKYIVLTVVYAPPGMNGGHSSSVVTYGSTSTTGTSTSISHSFTFGNTLSVSAGGDFGGNGANGEASFGTTHSTTDGQSMDIHKSTGYTITTSGPGQDGINHDEDAIYLALNPSLDISISDAGVSWGLTKTTTPIIIQRVYAGWLNGHVPMPTNVASALASAGITPADYLTILGRDPLALGATSMDPARFAPLNMTFPYIPPLTQADTVPTTNITLTDSAVQTTTTGTEDTYKVGISITGSSGFFGMVQAKLTDSLSWAWSSKISNSNTTGSTQSASVTIGGPAFGYTGPTAIEVYEDLVFHTFAFIPVAPLPSPNAKMVKGKRAG